MSNLAKTEDFNLPEIRFNREDFPDPDGPIIALIIPGLKMALTDCRISFVSWWKLPSFQFEKGAEKMTRKSISSNFIVICIFFLSPLPNLSDDTRHLAAESRVSFLLGISF